MTEREEKYLIGLGQIKDLGHANLINLMHYYDSAEAAWQSYRSWHKVLDISRSKLTELIANRKALNLESLYKYSRQVGAKIVSQRDKDYPAAFRNIYDPPYFIYYFGELPKEEDFCLTVVGSRKHSDYGRDLAKRTSKELVKIAGAVIVSGMAEGIDAIAHWGALNAGGRTVAVLGNGIDKIYPAINAKLYAEIKERGCIISEFPLGCESYGYNFPYRNRLMSALGQGVIVIEAHRGSGVFHTVSHALDQGKDVFAFPGSVFAPGSYAPHFLIKEGTAKPVFSTEDIIEEYFDLDLLYRDRHEENRERDFSSYAPEERKLLEALSKGELSFDALSVISGLASGELNAILTLWEVEGIIAKGPGQMYGLANYIDEVDNE